MKTITSHDAALPAKKSDGLLVVLFGLGGEPKWRGLFADFVKGNEDGFTIEEVERMADALVTTGEFVQPDGWESQPFILRTEAKPVRAIVKSVDWSYPTSTNATRFGCKGVGCWTLSLTHSGENHAMTRAISGHATIEAAFDAAAARPEPFATWASKSAVEYLSRRDGALALSKAEAKEFGDYRTNEEASRPSMKMWTPEGGAR